MTTSKEKRFAVKTRCFDGSWEDCWTEDGKPLRFRSPDEAQAELDEFLHDVKEAVARGDMDEEYDPEDYKIFLVDA